MAGGRLARAGNYLPGVLPLLLLLQTAPGPTLGEPDRLADVLARAEAAVRQASVTPGGWSAAMETEVATLGRLEGRIEGATLLEQTSSAVRWSSDGGYEQHVLGSRSFPNAIPLSRLSLLQIGWAVPSFFGERILMITRTGPRNMGYAETMRGPMAPQIVVHPLASDRERYYRYTGSGTPVRMRMPGWTVDRDFFRIEVVPRLDLEREETLFEGELYVDVATSLPVRLFGRFRTIGGNGNRGLFSFSAEMFQPTVTLVDLINQLVPEVGWAPLFQRFEIETASTRAVGYGGARRVITQFHEVRPLETAAGPVAIGASTLGYILTAAPRDSLRGFRQWYAEAGAATRSVSRDDFQRYRSDRFQPTGRPTLLLEGVRKSDFVRVNKIEGVYTGLALALRFRDAAPGLELRGKGGWAWSEETMRGTAGIAWRKGNRIVDFSGGRSLDATNKFRNQFEEPSVDGLYSRDNWDYVDRWWAGATGTWTLTATRGNILQADIGWARDQAVSRNMEHSVLRNSLLRPNRGITEGDYIRTRILFDWNPDVSPVFARDGIGSRVEIERGDGDLDYTRVEARLVARKTFSRAFVMTRLHLGAVFAGEPPPQQLFELGGPAGLPGYEYKEFAGDRAALLRVRGSLPLTFLDVPLRIGSWLDLSSLSPAISLGAQAAFTDASDASARDAIRRLGDRYDETTGAQLTTLTGEPLPASVATDKVLTSVDLRIGFFGDALGFGVARALQRGRKTEFFAVFGRQF